MNSSGAWTPRPAVTGGAWAHAPPPKSGSVRGAVMLPPLFDLFTCKSKKKHTARAVDFKFFLVFQICFFVLSFSAVFDLPLSAACFCFLFFCSDGRRLWVSSSLFLVVDPAVAKGERRCCCVTGGGLDGAGAAGCAAVGAGFPLLLCFRCGRRRWRPIWLLKLRSGDRRERSWLSRDD